jgi:hypothetical protein
MPDCVLAREGVSAERASGKPVPVLGVFPRIKASAGCKAVPRRTRAMDAGPAFPVRGSCVLAGLLPCRLLPMRVARRHDAVLPTFRMRIVFDLAWQIRTSRD